MTPEAAAHDVRATLRRLPDCFQLPVTFLTGKPYTDQQGPVLTPTVHLAAAAASMLLGLLTSGIGWYGRGPAGPALLLLGWAVTLHGMRNLRMMIFHQCAHRNMWGMPQADRLLGQFVAGLLVVQNFSAYAREHASDHHALHHMTLRDPTVQALLLTLGLRPGMSRSQLWRGVLLRLVSPRFHLRFAWARLRSCLTGSTPRQRRAFAGAYMLLAALMTGLDAWAFFAVAWLVPLFPLFQVSNVLRLCVKHTFPAPDMETRRGRAYFASLTTAVFLGDPAPPNTLAPWRKPWAWLSWTMRMLCVHFPSRYLVLTGDTVVHDYHHRHPMSREWANYIFARQRELERGHPGWPAYREVWGLVPAINLVLDSLSRADADEYDIARLPSVSDRALFAAFDD